MSTAGEGVAIEASQRKNRSEEILRRESVPVNESLPVIATTEEAKRRTKEEVAFRTLALLVVAVRAEGMDQPTVAQIIKDYGLREHFTPNEQEFIDSATPSEYDRIQFIWRYEAAWVLLWSLGFVDALDKPAAICDVPRAVGFMRDRDLAQFLADAKLRPMAEILDAADLAYRYDWAAVDARIKEQEAPAGLDASVTLERHYALNWLVGYMDQEWDDVSTDT